jgi:hypothetical protein
VLFAVVSGSQRDGSVGSPWRVVRLCARVDALEFLIFLKATIMRRSCALEAIFNCEWERNKYVVSRLNLLVYIIQSCPKAGWPKWVRLQLR